MALAVRPLTQHDAPWVRGVIRERWGAPTVVSRGVVSSPERLPGFVAELEDQNVGLLTFRIAGGECEVVTIDALLPGRGVGTALLDAVAEAARRERCRRVWAVTTNDNLDALRFYQRRGYFLVAVHRDAVTEVRDRKPTIPEVGEHGIPIRDELELELPLEG
jgi:GNAT superfamily N-acetyltransferase